MSKRHLITLAAGLTLLALPAPTQAIDAPGERVPITDPTLLERFGFDSGATNVYATPQAYEEMLMSPTERAAAGDGGNCLQPQPPTTEPLAPFGPARGYSPILYTEFLPTFSSGYGFAFDSRYCVSGSRFYDAQIRTLPHGSQLDRVAFWLYDDDGSQDIDVFVERICQPDFLGGDPEVTVLGSAATSDFSNGNITRCVDFTETVDLGSCAYRLRVNFGGASACTTEQGLRIQKAVAYWRRQVSPAPDTATFDDVPASHLFFQHIEALAASEITVGCDGNSFCPDAPLTRGQMATFLAKALGLHWGAISQ